MLLRRRVVLLALVTMVVGLVAGVPVGTASAASTPMAHRMYVAVVDNLGAYPQGYSTDEEMTRSVQAAGDYWVGELDGAIPSFDVVQPVVHVNSAETGCNVAYSMIDAAESALPKEAFEKGAHVVVLTPSQCSIGPTEAGVAYRGGQSLHAGGGLIAQMNDRGTVVVAHELGHTLGLNHANLERCTSTARTCPSTEYGDLTSVMGYGLRGSIPALGAVFRRRLGVEQKGEVKELTIPTRSTRTTTVRLRPRTDATGLRAVHVKDPADGKSYFVEYRPGIGRDAGAYDGVTGVGGGTTYVKGVVVTRADQDRSALQARRSGDQWFSAFAQGQTFTSTSRTMKVAVTATGATATVRVTLSSLKKLTSAAPTIVGTPKVGRRLTVRVGTWRPKPSFTYQWYFDGTAYPGATKSTFTPDSFVKGRRITVKVTGYRPGYVQSTRTSRATAAVTG